MVAEEKNYYEILGIAPQATTKEVAEAYRNLVRNHHPDRFTEAAEKEEAEQFLKGVTEAYNTLGRPAPRAKYDRELQTGITTAEQVKKSPQEQAREYFNQAMARIESDPSGALALFDFVLQLTPEDPNALFHAGMIRLRSPRWRVEGAKQVELAILKDPFNPRPVVQYAKALLEGGQKLRAERILTHALPNHPNDPDIEALLAKCAEGDSAPQGSGGIFGKKK